MTDHLNDTPERRPPVKTTVKRKRRPTYVVLAVLIVLGLVSGIIVYAEFVKSSRAKRVIASYGDEGSMSSSNYLVENGDPQTNVYRRVFYSVGEGMKASGDVTICNYAQGNPARTYENDISYVLSARFVTLGESGGAYVKADATAANVGTHTVKMTFKNGSAVTLSSSKLSHTFPASVLDRRMSSTDIVSLEFDENFHNAGALCLYLSAVPTASQAGVHTLDAVCGVALNSGEARNAWEGEFNEKSMTGVPAQPDYDGFNYLVTGMGRGVCTLSWDNRKLAISQVFLTENSLTAVTSGTTTSVTFNVDSDVKDRYDLQFYYADENVTFTDWDELTGGTSGNGCVRLVYVES